MIGKAICYFGSYNKGYSRNRIIQKGLIRNKVKIIDCNEEGILPLRYWRLIRSFWKKRQEFTSIIVGFPGHYDVPLAFLLGKIFHKLVFFDIFVSLYETYVLDRSIFKDNSFHSRLYFFVDWLGLRLADKIIVDGKTHFNLYQEIFDVRKDKLVNVYLGADNDFFYPKKSK